GIEAMHVGWQSGARIPGQHITADDVRKLDLTPKSITAVLVGLKSRLMAFRLQRAINTYPREALTAVLPGVALQELWGLVGVAETALSAVSWMVVLTAVLGLATMLLTSLNERRREMAILRSVGATPRTVIALLTAEAGVVTVAGVLAGVGLTYAGLALARPWIDRTYGIDLGIAAPTSGEIGMLAIVVGAGLVAGLIPAVRAYRQSLADGMSIKT
ncbi:MAG: ABC transporter permease, partial [Hyphomicrobiaceae bacterium]